MAEICVGIIAKRDADGNFLPAVPIKKNIETGANGVTEQENKNCDVFAGLLARYIKACEEEGRMPFETR